MPGDFNNLWVRPELLRSPAFRTITAPTSYLVLAEFYGRKRTRKKKGKDYEMINNGELTFTYAEAERKGISRAAFQRALDDLIGRGFIRVSRTGAGVHRVTTLYALTDAWKRYGTPDFEVVPRQRTGGRYKKVGFREGHPYHPRQGVVGGAEEAEPPGVGHGDL